jgi:hypothetical protein
VENNEALEMVFHQIKAASKKDYLLFTDADCYPTSTTKN